jgi:hypothetical protein
MSVCPVLVAGTFFPGTFFPGTFFPDPHLELDLDICGGVTEDRIRDFLKTCKVSFTAWQDEVVN